MFRPCTGTQEMFAAQEIRNLSNGQNQESGLRLHPQLVIKNPRLPQITLHGASLLCSAKAMGHGASECGNPKRVIEPLRRRETHGGDMLIFNFCVRFSRESKLSRDLLKIYSHAYALSTNQGPVTQKVDSAIHRVNCYPLESAIGFPNTYPIDCNLSDGWRYPTFGQPGPEVIPLTGVDLPTRYWRCARQILLFQI